MVKREGIVLITVVFLLCFIIIEGLGIEDGRFKDKESEIRVMGRGYKYGVEGITLQGYITDIEGKEINGRVLMGCTLWTDSIGGLVIWGDSDSIEINSGLLNYEIPITNEMIGINERLYLGISINKESVGRVKVGNVIWSYRSIESETSGISKSTRSLNNGLVSEEIPETGEVLKWDGGMWRPMEDEIGGVTGVDYLRDDRDTFGYLEGEGLKVNRYSILIDSVEIYSESLKTYLFTTRNNLIRKDPMWFSKFSYYYFRDLQDTNQYFYFNGGELKTTGPLYSKGIVDSGNLYTTGQIKSENYIYSKGIVDSGDLNVISPNLNIYSTGMIKSNNLIYSKGIVDSGNLYTTGRTNRFNYGLTLGYRWRENPDPSNDTLYNMSGLIVLHGNNYFYDDVTLIGDTLSNNQSYLGLLNLRDSSYIRIKPKPHQEISFRKQKTTSSVDLDSAWMILDRYSLKYMDYALQDSATKIGAGYGYFRDSVKTSSVKIGDGESVTEFIKVGSHAGIVFNGVDTFWLAKDTL